MEVFEGGRAQREARVETEERAQGPRMVSGRVGPGTSQGESTVKGGVRAPVFRVWADRKDVGRVLSRRGGRPTGEVRAHSRCTAGR